MATRNLSGDGDAPADFLDILNDEEDEDDEELDEDEEDEVPVAYVEVEYRNDSEYEGAAEAEEASEAEMIPEAEEASEAEMIPEADVASEAEMIPEADVASEAEIPEAKVVLETEPFEYNEPAPAAPMTSRSRSRSPLGRAPYAAVASSSSPVLKPFNVVVTAPLDDAMEEDHVFHLADGHQLFQQVEDVVEVAAEQQQQRRPRRGGAARHGGAAQRGRGRGRGRARGQVPRGGPQWVRGERLVQVHINDDDVPEELRVQIMCVVNAREAARVRVVSRARREREENVEEWFEADDGEFRSFFANEESCNHFEWSPMDDYQSAREKFLPQQTGAVKTTETAYGAFRQYWDEGIMAHIVTETNRYAAGLADSSTTFARDWYDTNIHELFILFSFWMMLGIIRMPSIKSCFTVNPLLQTNIFRKMFSRHRYENLCRVFHLNSSRPTVSTDPLYSLGPILDHLNTRFQETYIPSQNICIDESLTLWKGNLSFRQYIKAAQYGVKTFELCESSTGYLWSFFVYLGAGTSYDCGLPFTMQKSSSTVLRLIRPLLDKGYTLFMGNWFNSPLLARFLKTHKTDCVGTLRANRANVPPLMSVCKLKDGQFVARHSGDVVVLTFQDKKRKIATISTYHGDSQVQTVAKPHRPSLYKPQVVLDYNVGMGGVDRKDQMLEPYLLERKRGAKWNVKFFKHLLNCSILNARILLQSSSATLKEHIAFRLELVDQILQHHHQHVPKSRPSHPVSSSLGHPQPLVQHFPRQIDQIAPNGRRRRRRCTWCSQHKIQRATTYTCSVCDVALCVNPCFELYHAR